MDFSLKFAFSMMVSLMMATFFLYNLNDLSQSYKEKPLVLPTFEISNNDTINQLPKPKLNIEPIKLTLNEPYQLLDYVSAYDSIDGDITYKVKVYDNIVIEERGIYEARFIVENSNHMIANKIVKVRVD